MGGSSPASLLPPPTDNWPFQAVLTYLERVGQVFLPCCCTAFLGWNAAPLLAHHLQHLPEHRLFFQPSSDPFLDAPLPPDELNASLPLPCGLSIFLPFNTSTLLGTQAAGW